MPIPLEAWNWDEDRLLQEIAVRLPKSWGIEFGQKDDLLWHVSLLNENAETVWEEDEAAPNLVLLNALGWLELRSAPTPSNSPWAPRRQDIDARRLHEAAYRVRVRSDDPPDLDPKEIDSVYSGHPRKR